MEGIYAGVVLHQRVPSMEEAMVSSGKKRDAGNAGAGRRNGEGPEFGELTDDDEAGPCQTLRRVHKDNPATDNDNHSIYRNTQVDGALGERQRIGVPRPVRHTIQTQGRDRVRCGRGSA